VRWLAILLIVGCGSSSTPSSDGGGGAGTGGGGGVGTGGTGGAGGADSGVVPDAATTADASMSLDQGSMMMTGKTVDECFAGLRMLKGAMQDATSASADGKYRMRLALETADRGGTSGSYGWAAIRFALETPDGSVCVTDESALAKAYVGSHHNCMDVLTVTSGARTYVIRNPDAASDYVDKTKWRRYGSLAVLMGGAMIAGPITLQTAKCNTTTCSSGGPCQ
jgi:hypothetical protein